MDEQVIRLEGIADGRGWRAYAPEDEDWLRRQLRSKGRQVANMRLTPAEDGDVEGHAATPVVRVDATLDEDDGERQAISLRFPNPEEAGLFRRRLMGRGAITATVAFGAPSGAAGLPSGT